jgi:hypothetical protein
MEETKNVQCENCGASTSFDPSKVSMVCAFCGSEYLVEVPETEEEKQMKKDAEVILFSVERNQAKEKFNGWIKKGLFKPSDITRSFREKEFDGAYIPFFKITADARSTWNGRDKVVIREATDTEPAEYDYKDRRGEHSKNYKDYVAATKGLKQPEVDNILPFDDNDSKPYDRQLLMGFKTENPVIKQDNAENTGKERVKNFERNECSRDVDELLNIDTVISNLKSKLIMLPIWILVYTYNNEPYRVLINGQSGKISGQKPVSKVKVAIALFLVAAVIAALYFIFGRDK